MSGAMEDSSCSGGDASVDNARGSASADAFGRSVCEVCSKAIPVDQQSLQVKLGFKALDLSCYKACQALVRASTKQAGCLMELRAAQREDRLRGLVLALRTDERRARPREKLADVKEHIECLDSKRTVARHNKKALLSRRQLIV